jgi:hypothetical protein
MPRRGPDIAQAARPGPSETEDRGRRPPIAGNAPLDWKLPSMIHDRSPTGPTSLKDADRRHSERTASADEVTIRWLGGAAGTVRCRLLERSPGGLRILTALPPITGTLGTALAVLPRGTPLNRPVMVAWLRPVDGTGGFEVGLSYLDAAA